MAYRPVAICQPCYTATPRITRVITVPFGSVSWSSKQRDEADEAPIDVPEGAAPEVLRGEDQCYWCGDFGHRQEQCARHEAKLSRTALHWNDWRRVSSNYKRYSIDVLGFIPSLCAFCHQSHP